MRDLTRQLLDAAVLAPSSHNTQPWRFSIRDDTIAVRVDRTRSLPINDPDDRELTISCGAALFNLRVAAAHAKQPSLVELVPASPDPDALAVMHLGTGTVEAELAVLNAAIPSRRTCHGELDREDHIDTALLTNVVALEGATLVILDDAARAATSELVAIGDRRQFANPTWRAELASWMRSSRQSDGLPGSPLTRLVLRHVNLGRMTAKKDRQLALQAPVLAVLATPADTTADRLAAGQAVQRMLLTAAVNGWQAGFLNQPCQVPELRPQLAALLPSGTAPQLVIRIGIPARPAKSPRRRAVADVLDHDDVNTHVMNPTDGTTPAS